jgi:hypothetical protein
VARWAAIVRPILMRLSAMTPRPTRRLNPSSPSISAPLETMSALAHADAPLTPGAPSLPVAEPPLLLLSLARGALAGAIGDADPLDAFGLRRSLVLAGIKSGISGDQAGYTSQLCCVHLDCRHQLRGYGAAQRAVLPDVRHRTSRYLNNRAENSHRPTRRRERQIHASGRPSMRSGSSPRTQ